LVTLIRRVQPTVVVTHDETGGYFHPDHIRCCELVTLAFHAAGGPEFPHAGEPFQPGRLYYTAFSDRWLKVVITFMRLRRQDPTAVGRNQDIDLTRLGHRPAKLHARIDYRDYWEIKQRASAAHASQGGGVIGPGWLPQALRRYLLSRDTFIRAHPPAADGFRETDLFP
jgi:LmbE family N-acetylglucosaminyl deacetylase